MHLQIKKLKVDLFTTPRQKSLPGPIIISEAETNYSSNPVKGKDYEKLFQNLLL